MNMSNDIFKRQVALLIRIMPSVYRIKDFAVHGGTAINLFHKNMPRYSVDIDLTYIPITDREESLKAISKHLETLSISIKKTVPGIKIIHKAKVWKLYCTLDGATVIVEVNGVKRGVIGDVEDKELCEKAQKEFNMTCKAHTVSYTQLYGGKIAAALSRQHPRDLFDCSYMDIKSFEEVKEGLMLSLLGSDKPIIESLQPNAINQMEALENQFAGMTDIPFLYSDYERTSKALIERVNNSLTSTDKEFLISFEKGNPDWEKCIAGDLSIYPSVKWKLKNIDNFKKVNQLKYLQGIEKLQSFFTSNKSGNT